MCFALIPHCTFGVHVEANWLIHAVFMHAYKFRAPSTYRQCKITAEFNLRD